MADTTPSQRARELLLDLCVDWDGRPMGNSEEPRTTPSCGEIRRAIDEALAQGRADERRAVVTFLQESLGGPLAYIADSIEVGDHLTGTGG